MRFKLILLAAAVGAVGLALVVIGRSGGETAPAAPATAAAPAPVEPRHVASVRVAEQAQAPSTPPAPQAAAPRAMPYRPASYLLYSEERPAREPADDDRQPALGRILEITKADANQQAQIRKLWRTHEDGRRVLWKQAYPRVSGPRVLNSEELENLDLEFENNLFALLRPDQKQALSQELPPPGASHTPPPRMWQTPHAEE